MLSLELNSLMVVLGFILASAAAFVYLKYSKSPTSLALADSTIRRAKTIESETTNKSFRHFLFGLLLTLFLVFLLFNWTIYNNSDNELEDFFLNEELTIIPPKSSAAPPPPASESPVEIPPTETPVIPTPPQPVIIKVVEKPIEKVEQPKTVIEPNTTITNPTSTNPNSTSTDPNGKGSVTNTFGEEPVFASAEQMPKFPGCDNYPGDEKVKQNCSKEKLRDYITKNLNYPPDARINKIEGVVYVKFVVDKDGSISNVSLVKDPGYNLGEAAKKLVENMNRLPQKWTPAYQNGKPVRVLYTLPVGFKLNKTNSILK